MPCQILVGVYKYWYLWLFFTPASVLIYFLFKCIFRSAEYTLLKFWWKSLEIRSIFRYCRSWRGMHFCVQKQWHMQTFTFVLSFKTLSLKLTNENQMEYAKWCSQRFSSAYLPNCDLSRQYIMFLIPRLLPLEAFI